MSIERTSLNLIDKSSADDGPSVVIFQRNVDVNAQEPTIAWRVISNLVPGDNHPFALEQQLSIGANDANGALIPHTFSMPGQAWQLIDDGSGIVLQPVSNGGDATGETTIKNALTTGPVDISLYRDNRLLATAHEIGIGQTAHFNFGPDIFVMTAQNIQEGAEITDKILNDDLIEFCLPDVTSATIVMTDGPGGEGAPRFQFHLENVQRP